MNTETPRINKPSSSPAVPTDTSSNKSAHTHVSPIVDEKSKEYDWNNLEDRYEMIAEAAYFKAEQRGFAVGDEELDWLEAEQDLLEKMAEE